MTPTFNQVLHQHLQVIGDLAPLAPAIEQAGQLIAATQAGGGKLLLCGNGGSAADCQHFAAEFVVRYHLDRPALPAIALTTDSSILTAHSNDYGFETVFARQVEALGRTGDCLVAISTSGNSVNVIAAARQARRQGLSVIALTGATGGALAGLSDCPVVVPSDVTARIQEAHALIAHWWCQCAEPS